MGGTSNHFRTATLKDIGAWDAFNVTEDADLGIRMARLGLRVESLACVTLEEAPETVTAWVRQRSRWIKGWMQTLLVHSARPGKLLADLGWGNLIAFYMFVGGMVLSLCVHGLFLTGTIARLIYDLVTVGTTDVWAVAGLARCCSGTQALSSSASSDWTGSGARISFPGWLLCRPIGSWRGAR